MRPIHLVIALLLTLPTLARADVHDEVEPVLPETLFMEAGWTGHVQNDAIDDAWPLVGVNGWGVSVGMRHSPWLVTEARFDLVEDDTASGYGGQLAMVFDPGWNIAPLLGSWVGYRALEMDWTTGSGLCVVCDPDFDIESEGMTQRRMALAGVETGLRLRFGPLVATTTAQWAVPVWSRQRSVVHSVGNTGRPEYVQPGGFGEFNLGMKLGVRW